VTAYMVWAKEQKTLHADKFPHIELSGAKLGELWAQVPHAQKRMWKNRAAKQMKASGENIKNTAPPKKPRGRKRTKLTKTDGSVGDSTKPSVKKPVGKGKLKRRKMPDSFLIEEDDVITPPPKRQHPELLGLAKSGKGKGKGKGKFKPIDSFGRVSEVMKNGRKSSARSVGGGNLNVASMRAVPGGGKSTGTKMQ